MTPDHVSARFRMEASVAFSIVASITIAYFERQRMQSLDAPVATFYCIYILASGLLGYHLARWYDASDSGMLETISVPIVISLLAVAISSFAFVVPEVATNSESRFAPTLLQDLGGAMLLVYAFLVIAGPISLIAGVVASIGLHFRARAERAA